MTRRHQVKKTDNNEAAIVKALRAIPGVKVETDHDDILIGYKRRNYWIEIKNPDEVDKQGRPYAKKSKTAKKQKELLDHWTGTYMIATTLDEILIKIGVMK